MFVRRLVNWVTSWGGPLGTASGMQLPLPTAPVIDQTTGVPPDAALQIAAVYSCVELLANTIGTLPLFVYKDVGEGRVPARDSRLWFLLHERPNAWMTPSEFLSTMVVNRMLRGNAYARIERDAGGQPIALIPVSPDQMEVSIVEGGEVYVYYQDGEVSAWAPENVLHWKGMGNGFMGLSKLDFMRASLNEGIHAQENANTLFGKGSKPTGVLQTDSALNETQLKALMARFGAQMTSSTGGLLIADRGLKYTQMSLSPADAQLLETRKFSVEEICRWFGVPSVLVGANGVTTWGSGIEQITKGFHTYTIGPLCKQLEQALERRLIGITERGITIEFKTDAFLRTDQSSRAAFYSQMAQNGVMSRNEIRKLENLPPVEGGDDLTAQSNLVPLGSLGKVPTASSPANGEPVRQ